MDERIKKYLGDIKIAIHEIEEASEMRSRTFRHLPMIMFSANL